MLYLRISLLLAVLFISGCTEKEFGGITQKEFIVGGEKVIVGSQMLGAGEEKFKPEVQLNKWGGETYLKISSDDVGDDKATQKDDKIVWQTNKKTYEFYTLPKTEQMEDGGFEYNIILKEKPDTNIVSLKIETDDLDFFYTPIEYDEDEIANNAYRPENVKGSYAVYHKTKANNKYKTGKAFHIYRPLIFDSKGKETWGVLNIKNGILTITIDKNFLNNADYPVSVDPTFGYTTVGGTETQWAANTMRGWEYTTTEEGSIYHICFYTKATAGTTNDFRGVVYKVSDDSRVTFGAEISNNSTTAVWKCASVTATTLANATAYKIGIWISDEVQSPWLYHDAGLTQYRDNTVYHATNNPPATFTEDVSTADRKISIYASYSCTSGTCTDTYDVVGTWTWVAPTGVTSAEVTCWGGGGYGELADEGGGGGGGAYAYDSSIAVTAGNSYSVVVGGIAGDSTFNANDLVAKGGTTSTGDAGGAGGQAGSCVGEVVYSGGNGGAGNGTSGGGGGGAGGQDGAGVNGSDTIPNTGGVGGAGDNGSGGAGGATGTQTGGNGGNSVLGGGGGGGGDQTFYGGYGGTYGGGGGGRGNATTAVGASGACIITYTVGEAPPAEGGATADEQNIIFFE
jgi:hypothetical protein